MSEMQTYRPGAGDLRVVSEPAVPMAGQLDPTGGRLVAWAESLSAAHRIATALANTAFAPAHFKGRPDDAAAAILYGDEIGLTPTAALRSIFVVSGTPGLYARSMAALVMSRGHQIWTVEESDTRVTVAGRRRGSDREESSTWTIDRARKAGFTSNAQYTKNPQAMLYARALGDVARRIAPDVLAGLATTVEEIQLAEPEATATVSRGTSSGTQRVSRARKPTPAAPEPSLEEPVRLPETEAAQPQEPADPNVATPAQVQRLAIAMGKAGITERDDRLSWLSQRLRRAVESSKELTKAEAASAIDALEAGEPDESEPSLDGDDPWQA